MIRRIVRLIWREETGDEIPFWNLLGPISIMCTVSLAGSWDLMLVALVGLFLTASLHKRGFAYSLILLAADAVVRHTFFDPDEHLWLAGLELSLALALFISYLVFEQGTLFIQSLTGQLEALSSSLKNLEDALEKEREEIAAERIAFQQKFDVFQKEFEELQGNHNSILILNEVLRKLNAKLTEQKEALEDVSLNQQRKIGEVQLHFAEAEKELSRLKNSDVMALENRGLQKELNEARVQREQTHLINETLARLHAKECLKGKEATELKEKLQLEIATLRSESQMLHKRLAQHAEERNQAELLFRSLQEEQVEKNVLKERLERTDAYQPRVEALEQEKTQLAERLKAAEKSELEYRALLSRADSEKRALETQLEEERAKLASELGHAQERVYSLSQIEPLFKQLKTQFEERNQVLHQTRADLFKTDTELQTLKIEKNHWQLAPNPIPATLLHELDRLADEIKALEEENAEMQSLITLLSSQPASNLPAPPL